VNQQIDNQTAVIEKGKKDFKGWSACKEVSSNLFSAIFRFIVRNLDISKVSVKEERDEEKDENKFNFQ
jgi:hypothetical protein